jgi:hypothetical protein
MWEFVRADLQSFGAPANNGGVLEHPETIAHKTPKCEIKAIARAHFLFMIVTGKYGNAWWFAIF